MNIKQIDKLYEWKVCQSAIEWVVDHPGVQYDELWGICDRSDWMIGLCIKLNVDVALVERTSRDIVRSLLHLVPKEESSIHRAIDVVYKYVGGSAKHKDLVDARCDVWETYAKAARDYRVIVSSIAYAATAVTYGGYDSAYAATHRCNEVAYRTCSDNRYCMGLADIVRRNIKRPEWIVNSSS